jgi:predicted phage tail protein
MEEQNFYSDNAVSVTSARVVMNELTFALRNISSVRTLTVAPSHSLDIILICIGLLIALMGLCFGGVGAGAESGGAIGGGIFILIVGVALVAGGIYTYAKKKPTYYVYLGTNAGEQRGISSPDKSYIDAIVKAINEAIVHKG